MEPGHPVAPSHSPVLDHHPPHEPTTVVGDEEQPHEKKSIMTRIQNKVNKLKHNYNKKRHAHDQVSEVPVEEESEEFDDSNEDMDVNSEVSSPIVYDSPAASRELDISGIVNPDGRDEPPVTPETMKAIPAEEEPIAPLPYGSVTSTTTDDADANLPTSAGPTPGNESSVPPEVLSSLREMSISGQRRDQPPSETQPGPEDEILVNHMSSDMEKKPSYTEKLYTTAAADEAAVSAAPTEYSAGTVSKPAGTPPPSYSETEFAAKDAAVSAAFAAKDAAVSAASTEYSAGTVSEPTGTPPPSYSEKFSSTAFAAKDAAAKDPAASAASTEVSGLTGTPPPSYSEKFPSTGFAAKDAAVSAASTEYSAGNLSGSTGTPPPSYSEEFSSTAFSAKDAAVSAAFTVKDAAVSAVSTEVSGPTGAAAPPPSYSDKFPSTAFAAKDTTVSEASTEYSAGNLSGSTDTPPPSYSEKLSSTAFAAKDAAVSAASMAYAKVAGKEEGAHSSETSGEVVTPVSNVAGAEEGADEKMGSYTDRLSGTAWAAKDAAVSAASSMYGMMVGAGAAMMGNVVETEQGKGVSASEFSAEKLQPGEEDKALGEDEVVAKGRIELPEVTSREVVSDAPAEVLFDTPPAVDRMSGGYTGQGIVEKMREAAASLVGGGGDVADASAEAPSGGTVDTPTGEEDKALGEDEVVVKGRIELPEVTSREVLSDAPAEILFDTPPAVDRMSGGYTGQGIVEKMRVAAASLVGGGGDEADASAEAPSGGTVDTPAANYSGGGRGGVADTPEIFVEAPGGGEGEERDSKGLGV